MATLNDHDMKSMTDYLLGRASEVKPIEPPVDLFNLARIQNVTAVDFRPMLLTGGLSSGSSGFVIYVQDLRLPRPKEVAVSDSMEGRPKMTTRQRFTMAHELAHTLLFDNSVPPQPRADSPKGKTLEALCQRFAGRILMPQKLIEAEVAKHPKLDARNILDLAQHFDVSVEAMLRRCDELTDVQDSDRAVLYLRTSSSGTYKIASFFCSRWFRERMGCPKFSMSPAEWLSRFVDENFWSDPKATRTFRDADGEIDIARVLAKGHRHFVELERRHLQFPIVGELREDSA